MINPPNGAPQQGPFLMPQDPSLPKPLFPDFTPDEAEQMEIVSICNSFKRNAIDAASEKKERMRTAYAYVRNRFVGNDLLPILSTLGSEKDANKQRPRVFMPLSRQQAKTIYSQLKMNLFPNDSDYFRVRSKTSKGVPYENNLTEGCKYVFKESCISEKLGAGLYPLTWSGVYNVFPTVKEERFPEWQFQKGEMDPLYGQAPDIITPRFVENPQKIDVTCLNPLNFYIDPLTQDPERAKWVYCDSKRYKDISDSNLYINKDKLEGIKSKTTHRDVAGSGMSTAEITDQQDVFTDTEDRVRYDLYYFPYLKTELNEYQNFVVGVAGEQVLIRFSPNTYPRGMNPAVFCSWMYDPLDPYSQGPIEDMIDIQKNINMIRNYQLESMSRAGNRFVAKPNADLSNLFGVAGGVAVAEDPATDVVSLMGDFSEYQVLENTIGVLKAEAQLVSGSQMPFQGSSSVDYQKTATELNIVNEQSISVTREVIEHIGVMGVQKALERLMYLVADMYTSPIEIPMTDSAGNRIFQMIDFSLLKSGEFTIELIGINPSQSKQAQINGILKLMEMVDLESLPVIRPVIENIGELLGLKNIKELLDEVIKNLYGEMARQQAEEQAQLAASQQPGMAGVPSPPPPGAGQPI